MIIFVCTILTSVFLMFPVFPAYPALPEKVEPIAQVYEIQGKVTVKNSSDGKPAQVMKGSLLGKEDSLTLDKNASVGLYFKNSGRKEVQAKQDQLVCKVADLLPQTEAYGQTVPLFGATRGPATLESVSIAGGFFYTQQTIVLDSPPLIEFKIFNGSGEVIVPGGATIEISKNSAVLASQKFDSLGFGSPYAYRCPELKGGAEYNVEITLDLKDVLGNVMSIGFPLYIADFSDKSLESRYASFSDSLYRSFESTSAEYKGKKHTISLIKQLVAGSDSAQPVIVIEFFIAQG